MIYKDAYAMNGCWFFHKGIEGKFIKLSEKTEDIITSFIEDLNNKYRNEIIIKFDYTFILDTFAFSTNGRRSFVPSFKFQSSFKNKETAIEASNDIIFFIKHQFDSDNVIIIIASSDIDDNSGKHNKSLAYTRSGTYLDAPEMWMDKWDKDNKIIVLEDKYLRKVMLNYEQFQNEGFLNKVKNIFKEKPKEDDYLAIKLMKYLKNNNIKIECSKQHSYGFGDTKETYTFLIHKDTEFDPLKNEDYVDDVNVSIIYQRKSDKIEEVKLNEEVLSIRNELKIQLLYTIKNKMK